MTPLTEYSADHKFLVDAAATAAGLTDPVAFIPGGYVYTLTANAARGPLVPIDGALMRQWSARGKYYPGTNFGIRLYTLGDIPFARCTAHTNSMLDQNAYDFCVVSKADYLKLFHAVLRLGRTKVEDHPPPVMPDAHFESLRQNTLDYLERNNLKRIKELGGRAKRGLLLTGPPGNGKTSACRWLWEECQRHGYEYQIVSPDAYQAARRSCNPVEAVKALFTVGRCGIIFFDDLDIALRDRNTVRETDDQAVFLSALDGMEVHEGVVDVFTTNCGLDLIDPAFKRPGRIDLVLHFTLPDAPLRRRLMDRWHADIRGNIDLDAATEQTEGRSFAEVEELKNLLILHYIETGAWDWGWATGQFRQNRTELAEAARPVGFAPLATAGTNGNGTGH